MQLLTNPKIGWRSLRAIALSILAFAMVTACSGTAGISNGDRAQLPSPEQCRPVEFVVNTPCIPREPQRIVALGGLDHLLSLGVRPIASNELGEGDVHFQGKLQGIEDVGGVNTLNLEKIASLQPDLIIGGDYAEIGYDLLSQIAPTVLLPFGHSGEWKTHLREYAEILGKTATADRVLADYEARLARFRAQMGAELAETEVSVVRVYPDRVNLYLKDSFCGTIIADAGLSRPPAQDLSAREAKALVGNPIQMSVSRERIFDADGDVIFLWTTGHNPEVLRQATAEKTKLKADPLWSRLEAVQADRVYEVPSYWVGDGPIAANAVLDDLFEYLVEASPS